MDIPRLAARTVLVSCTSSHTHTHTHTGWYRLLLHVLARFALKRVGVAHFWKCDGLITPLINPHWMEFHIFYHSKACDRTTRPLRWAVASTRPESLSSRCNGSISGPAYVQLETVISTAHAVSAMHACTKTMKAPTPVSGTHAALLDWANTQGPAYIWALDVDGGGDHCMISQWYEAKRTAEAAS